MTRARAIVLALLAGLWATPALSQTDAPAPPPVGRKLIEIYRLAPGQHEAFLRAIARFDEVNERAGIPPRQLYVHSDGASWDFLLIQDAKYPEGKGELVDRVYDELGLPPGARFFTEFRKFILEHSDTFASGPTTAAAYLARLDATPHVRADGSPIADDGRYVLARSVPLGGTPRWDYVQVDAPARRLYLAHDRVVEVIDLDSRTVAGRVAGLAGAHGIALAPEIGRGFVASSDRHAVSAFDLRTLEVIGEAKVGREPDSVTFEPVSRRLLVWNGGSQDVSILDAGTLRALKTVPLGGTPEFAVADGRGAVFVNIEESHEILHVDAAAGAVVRRLPLPGCTEPSGLAIDAATDRLFSACGNAVLAVTDAKTGRSLGRAAIGRGADAVVFDPASSRVFVSNGEGFVSIFDASGTGPIRPLAVVQTRVTGRTLGVDPQTGALYVPAADMEVDWGARSATFAKDGLRLHVFERRIP